MKLMLEVTDLEGNPRDVCAGFSHQIRYEELSGRTVTSWVTSPPGVRDFALLAWIVEGEGQPFREWTDSVEMVTLTGTEEATPTKPEAAPVSQ